MPFKDTFNSLKSKWEDIQKEHGGSGYPGQQQQQQPPPVPYGTHPSQAGMSQHNTVYWQPHFDPSTPVGADWDQKQGNNNGWGNAELENYTSNPENSFYTPDHKLVLRAIANNSSPSPERKYTSARLVSRQKLSRSRGCLTGVLSSPCAPGIWPAFWLLPAEPFTWPHEGEVDIAETWNGDRNNKSCLHWGFFTGEDSQKHRTIGTQIDDMDRRPVRYEFAWEQDEGSGQGKMLWWIDGRAVMKAVIPAGTRQLRDWTILLNVAMGGNVCAGRTPQDGHYDFVVHELRLSEEPDGGWQRFGGDWERCREGNAM